MKSHFTRLAASTALALALTAPAQAQSAPEQPGVFSAENLIGWVAQMAVSYGRLIADVRYGSLAVDGHGSLIMRDLQIAGLGRHETCRISLDRLQISGLSFRVQDAATSRLDLSGLSVATACFGMDGAMIAAVIDDDAIRLETVALDARQSFGSGALAMDIEAIAPGLARIEGSADFDYVSAFIPEFFERMSDDYSGETLPDAAPLDGTADLADGPPEMGVGGTLRSAHLSLEDLGGWQKIQPILPPEATSPEALQSLVTETPGTPLHALQQAVVETLQGFVTQPGRMTAEIRPAAPLDFDSSEWSDPEQALLLFAPTFSNAAPTPPLALIANPDDDADPRALGLALAEGKGLPRNPRRAIELLTPLQQDGEVALTLARLTTDADPVAAYAHAMTAAGLGAAGALAALDQIEARLTTEQLIAAQPEVTAPLPEETFASVIALRDAALAQEQGDAVPRSYALALRLAGSAAAAGDGPAQALLTRLEARFADAPAWAELRGAAADQALADWREQDLSTRFSGD